MNEFDEWEDDEESFELIEDPVAFQDSLEHQEIAEKLIADYMDVFFADKETYSGFPIDLQAIKSREYVSLVLDTDLISATIMAYKSLECHDFEEAESDIQMVVSILADASQRNIPKTFSGGLLLMELELCCAVTIKM